MIVIAVFVVMGEVAAAVVVQCCCSRRVVHRVRFDNAFIISSRYVFDIISMMCAQFKLVDSFDDDQNAQSLQYSYLITQLPQDVLREAIRLLHFLRR